MNLAPSLPDPSDLADALVAHEVATSPHPRAMARALLRAAGNAIARIESEEDAAHAHFARWSEHNKRSSREARKTGSRR